MINKNQKPEYRNQRAGLKTRDDRRGMKDEKLFFPLLARTFYLFSLQSIFWLLVTGFWLLFIPSKLLAVDYPIIPDSFDHTKFIPPEYQQLDNYAFTIPTNTGVAQVAAEVPVYSTDQQGGLICRMGGKMLWQQGNNGDTIYAINGQKAHKVHANGTRIETYRWQGQGWVEVLNELGEIKGYEKHTMQGLMHRYNSKQHLLESYSYDSDKGGYWVYNHVTHISKRFEKEKPVEERMGDRGSLIAYWTEEGEFLFRHSWVQVLIRDEEGKIVTDASGMPQHKKEQIKTKYNKYNEILESYDYRGEVVEQYEWVDHRLKRTVNPRDLTYKLYGDYGLIEEGKIVEGEYIPDRKHLWQGSKHTGVNYLILDPLMGDGYIYSGQYMSYTVDEDADEVGWEVNRFNKEWFDLWCAGRNLPLFQEGDRALEQDYVYFYEVQDLGVEQLKYFFHTSKATAEQIYAVIGADKKAGKASAGLFAIAQYGLPATQEYLAEMTLINEYNEEKAVIRPLEKTRALGMQMLINQAETFLQYGEYEGVLNACAQFEKDYVEDDSEFDSELGKSYLEILRYQVQALEKLGMDDEAAAQRSFIRDTFSDLARQWGGKYKDIIDQII